MGPPSNDSIPCNSTIFYKNLKENNAEKMRFKVSPGSSRLCIAPLHVCPSRLDPLHINSHIFYELYLPYLLMLLCKLAFDSNMHPHSLARYKFIMKILLYVYMQRIQPGGADMKRGNIQPEVGRCEDKPGVTMRNIG